jgi:hypothetical protein
MPYIKKYYTTEDEIEYIKGLGSHTPNDVPRVELLKSYIGGANDRNWGQIDKDKVIAFAKNELLKEGLKLNLEKIDISQQEQ